MGLGAKANAPIYGFGCRNGEMEEVSVMRPGSVITRRRALDGRQSGLGPCEGRLNRVERQFRSFGFAQQRVMKAALRGMHVQLAGRELTKGNL